MARSLQSSQKNNRQELLQLHLLVLLPHHSNDVFTEGRPLGLSNRKDRSRRNWTSASMDIRPVPMCGMGSLQPPRCAGAPKGHGIRGSLIPDAVGVIDE